ncbi:hypothetical protein [Micromonospora sp. NPDC004551]|uniref:hypothetical protein n=1 Tax=Micromonospora sp. NPDC004551 TaxID=3154284 RepID=UPI0033BA1101
MGDSAWWSLSDLNAEVPDHHYGSTVENLRECYGASEHLACWRIEQVEVARVDPFQLFDDPDDTEGNDKIESIRAALRTGRPLPAVILIHHPRAGTHPYRLIEGKHRYNAVYRENLPLIDAWVAHLSCCGGPDVAC